MFFSGRKLGQYADQALLKSSLFQNKTPDLSLKYILIQVHDQQGQHYEQRKKGQKETIVLKKETKQRKNGTKKQKTASSRVEPGLSARSNNSLTTAPQ